MLDILIKDGWVADGTGNPTYPANIAIKGDRIVEVGRLKGASRAGSTRAARVIDATGKIVCPGFVDTHSHTDRTILANPTAQSTIRQGVTTEIVGHCGHSHAPIGIDGAGAQNLREMGFEGDIVWTTFAEYLAHVQQMGTSCNLGWMVGHNTVRFAAGLTGPDYTEEQMRAMQALVREAMEAGAMGISSGLEFEPGRRATAEEVVQVAKVVGEYDGYHASHIRNRAVHFQEAIDEFIDITRRSGTRGQVAHLNVRYNTGEQQDTWQRAVDTLVQARREGLDVAADCTPYQDGEGLPRAILPDWVMADGPDRAAEILSDPEMRMQLRTQCDRYWSFIHRGDFDRVTISRSDRHPELMGKNLVEIGKLWNKHPWDVLFDLLVLAFRKEDRIAYVGRLFTREHVIAQITHPLINLGVDAVTVATEGPLSKTYLHPLPYAGMIHYLTHWVKKERALSLEEAIRKMSSMGATRFGLRDRGQLRSGAYADVVVFDYDALDDGATVEHPVAYCKGVEFVLVNGVPVIDGSEHTGARPGRTVHYS